MILGTHTSENEPNYLMIAQVQLPLTTPRAKLVSRRRTVRVRWVWLRHRKYLLIWDLRSPSASKPIQSVVAHSMEVLCNELNFKSREGSPITEVEPYIPFNINPAGMQPVLTTTYLLAFPSILASIVGSPFLLHVKDILNPESTVGAPPWVYYSVYAFFVFLFNIFDIVSVTYSFFFSA
ncbi:unnamed protein product [Brassica napus]|uniref:(rape) hypothetical protein n=1 Tax=Brassica napus TaxID=3708 RepID=A0A816I5V4_BRANA|nr:unnamed protein product [Brassica napus]